MQRTKTLLLVLVVLATPVLAGCANQGDGSLATTEPTDGTATEAPTMDGGATATPTDGGSAFSDAEEREIRQSAFAAMQGVADVQLEGTLNQTVSTATGGSQSSTVTFDVTIDAEQRRLVVDQSVSVQGRTVNQTTYFVDGSLYLRSQAFVRQYGSEWVTQNVSDRYDQLWRNRSALSLHTNLLNVTEDVTVTGTETVRGEEAYVLSLRPTDAELAELSGINFAGNEVNEFDATMYVSTETNLVLRSDFHVNETVTVRGQEIQQVIDVRREFVAYDQGVNVTLPSEADGAVPVGNQSVATIPRSVTV